MEGGVGGTRDKRGPLFPSARVVPCLIAASRLCFTFKQPHTHTHTMVHTVIYSLDESQTDSGLVLFEFQGSFTTKEENVQQLKIGNVDIDNVRI